MVTAVLGVAFGVVFAGWNVLTSALFSGAVNPPAYLVSGVWLAPAVLAGLIVRKPGAAVFAEVVAAAVSAILGSVWGVDAILSGAIQGAGAELVFALFLYRSFALPVAMLAGAGAAVGEWLHDIPIYYPDLAFGRAARHRRLHAAQRRRHRRPGLVAAGAGAGPDRRAGRLPVRKRAATGGLT